MKIILNGTPWPQMRARHSKNGHTYKAPEQAQAENQDVWEMVTARKGAPPITGPVFLKVEFVFLRPASHFGTGRNRETMKSTAPEHHINKPDLDNLEKHVKDCATKSGIWVDDCQVVKISSLKRYGDSPHTIIEIEEIG